MGLIAIEVAKISFYPPSKGYAVVLREIDGDRQLPVIVGAYEAQAIALALENIDMPRPMTHDLFGSFLDTFDSIVNEVVISDLVDGTFYAKIRLEVDGYGDKEIDSRPSDAVAIALRVDAPIFVEETVMEEAGIQSEDDETEEEELLSVGGRETLVALRAQLRRAVESENYERAAELRDRISNLEEEKKTR